MATHRNSVHDRICDLLVGERAWIESSRDKFIGVMQKVSAKSRYPEALRHHEFTCKAFTAVGDIGETVILVRVERVE